MGCRWHLTVSGMRSGDFCVVKSESGEQKCQAAHLLSHTKLDLAVLEDGRVPQSTAASPANEVDGSLLGHRRRVRLALVAASPVHFKAPLYRLVAADPRIDFTAI